MRDAHAMFLLYLLEPSDFIRVKFDPKISDQILM